MNDTSTSLPLVSVALPCYNHERYVQQCIQSIIDQDYPNLELILIDDGSRDGSVEKMRAMLPACEARFTRFEFRARPNVGLAATLNEMLEWCQGEYFSAVASDDAMLPHKTRLEVDYLQRHPQ
ncbi:MAG: glycosyl transferase family 2, partial [Moraxellaceae bacterium]|nr:glycosyl transferase family 2 [Moraxellaceae bacterium]